MSDTIPVSVVVPVYNELKTVPSLVDALDDQAFPETFEVIFVDNGSTDGTRSRLEQLTSHRRNFRVIQHTERQSSYAARNEGVRRAEGEIIAFTDADCRPTSEWLRSGVQTLRETGIELAAGPVRVTFENQEPNLWEYLDAAVHLNQRDYVEDGWGATANLFVRSDCFDAYGTFEPRLTSGGDCEFGKRVTGAGGRIDFAEDAVVRHPARRTFLSLMKKERRIALGHKQLAAMGKRQLPELSVKDFLPAVWIPEHEDVELGPAMKLKVLLGANCIRWVQSWYRL